MSRIEVTTKVIRIQEKTQKKQQQENEPLYIIRLEQKKPKPRVTWTQDTIDNQHMNKLKSNLCCIYHRPGESSSDTCTSDDEGNALERDRNTKKQHKKKCSKTKKKREEQQRKKKQLQQKLKEQK